MTKQEIIAKYAIHEGDTGSPEVQIALLTARINHLNEHLSVNKNDHHSIESEKVRAKAQGGLQHTRLAFYSDLKNRRRHLYACVCF